jgi:hypothetical protein
MPRKQNSDPNGPGGFLVKTDNRRKRELFRLACDVLQIDMKSFFDTAMKQTILNAITMMEFEAEENKRLLIDDAKKELENLWPQKKVAIGYASMI